MGLPGDRLQGGGPRLSPGESGNKPGPLQDGPDLQRASGVVCRKDPSQTSALASSHPWGIEDRQGVAGSGAVSGLGWL